MLGWVRDWKGEDNDILERTGVGKAENMRWKSDDDGAGVDELLDCALWGVDGSPLGCMGRLVSSYATKQHNRR